MREIKNKNDYLKKRGYSIEGLSKKEIKKLCEKVHKKIFEEGYKNRVEKLKKCGKIKEKRVIKGNCKYCNTYFKFIIDGSREPYNYMKDGFCSFECYKVSGERFKDYKKKVVLNKKGYINDLEKDYTEILGNQTSKNMKKYVNKKRSEDENYFHIKSKKSVKLRKKNFLIKNFIVDNVDNLDEETINKLFLKYFNDIEKHGDKIKKGILKKYGSKKEITKSFSKRYKIAYKNYLKKIGINEFNISEEENKEYRYKFNKRHKMKKDVVEWKKTHLINIGIDIDGMDILDIEKRYSEYLSKRLFFHDNLYNGYKKTKKGWYNFKNIKRKLFYRSSWEEKVFSEIDLMILDGIVVDVDVPIRIEYIYKYKRHYYPDIWYKLSDGKEFICEIKPKSKLNEIQNIMKFKYASEKHKNFKVLTEDEIFDKDFRKYIVGEKI